MTMTACLIAFAAMNSTAAQTYTNPVYAKNFPDPFVVQHEDTFYAFATHSGPGGFQAMSSKDLVSWMPEKPISTPSWSKDHLWAPEVYQKDGKWYFFFSALNEQTGKRDLAVSVSDSLLGPYKDLAVLVTGISENEGTSPDGAIDPSLYFEGGKTYLLYIREAQPRALKMVELAPDFTKVVGTAKNLLMADPEADKGILDAPTLIKRDGTYWLFYSSGWFQSWKRDACYRVRYATASSLMGPYKKTGEPILDTVADKVYSPGHQSIFQVPNGDWWIAYHAWDAQGEPLYGHNDLGRTLRIDRLQWTDKGPKVAGPTITPQAAPNVR